jgi:hypothetical protein
MDAAFREMFEGLKQTAEGIRQAGEGIIVASEGMKRTADAAMHANSEHEELRETVSRLEKLVLELVERKNGKS